MPTRFYLDGEHNQTTLDCRLLYLHLLHFTPEYLFQKLLMCKYILPVFKFPFLGLRMFVLIATCIDVVVHANIYV